MAKSPTPAYREQLAVTVQLAEAESALWQLRYGFDQFLHGDAATRRRIVDDEAKWYALLEGRLAAYAASPTHTSEEMAALAELRAAYSRYKEARPKFFELAAAGRSDDAQAWRALTTTPYGAATVAAFERQIALEHKMAEEVRLHAETVVQRARWTVLGITAALSTLLFGAYLLARRSLRPLVALRDRALQAIHDTLGENVAHAHAHAHASNEITEVEDSFNLLVEKFSEHIGELRDTQARLAGQQRILEDTVARRTEELRATLAASERQTHEAALRGEMGEMLQSCLDLAEAGRIVERYLLQLFPAAAGILYLSDERHESVAVAANWGTADRRPASAEFEFADCWALRRGKAHFSDKDEAATLCTHVARPLEGASLCLPLTAHGETVGLLHLTCARCAAPEGVDHCCLRVSLAESVAAQLGMAIANLRLRESLRQQSLRDTLTGLYNRRHLEAALPREIGRAVRSGRPLAVFMLDVDHFKNFNDSHGHEAGDAVLRALGKALNDNCRQGDTACRFGGEEFTVFLPDADEAAAREWGERLRLRVRSMEVKSGATLLPRITISLGLALHPAHGGDAETLLQAADLALYDAKHAGRDRLMASGEAALPAANGT